MLKWSSLPTTAPTHWTDQWILFQSWESYLNVFLRLRSVGNGEENVKCKKCNIGIIDLASLKLDKK